MSSELTGITIQVMFLIAFMKQVVIDRKLKASESRFNQKFLDFAEYYGIVIRLCYPYRPET